MKVVALNTCSINGQPSGTRVAFRMNHQLDFGSFSHLSSDNFFFDPFRFNPTDLINNSVANAKFGTQLDFLRTACNNPLHAIFSLATGIPGECKVVHTLRHHYTNVAHPTEDVKEMTVIEGGGQEAQLLRVNPDLSLLSSTKMSCPSIDYWANKNFADIDPDNIPKDLMGLTTVVASFLIPASFADALHRLGLDLLDATVAFDLIFELVDEAEKHLMAIDNRENTMITRRLPRGRQTSSTRYPWINVDRARAIRPWLPIINALWATTQKDHTFPAGFERSTNPRSLGWFFRAMGAIKAKDVDFEEHFQDESTLLEITCPGMDSMPELPLTLNKPTHSDAHLIPTNRPTPRGPMDDFVLRDSKPSASTTRQPNRKPAAKDPRLAKPSGASKKGATATSKHPRTQSNPSSNLDSNQRAHAEASTVVYPEDAIMNDSDDESLFGSSPAPKRHKTMPCPGASADTDPSPFDEPTGRPIPVPTATMDGDHCGNHWKPHRPATPHPLREEDLDLNQLDDRFAAPNARLDAMYLLNEDAVDEEIDVSESPQQQNDGFFHAPKPFQGGPNFNPNYSVPPTAPRTNFNNNGSHQPVNHVVQHYASAPPAHHQDAFVHVMREISGLVKAQNEMQERALEQREAHHQDREEKRISSSTRTAHLNAATIDGRNPANALTSYNETYLKAKNPVEARDLIERDMQANECQVALPPHIGRSVHTGRWHCDRNRPGGLSIFAMPVSANNTPLQDFDYDQAFRDHENGRELSNRASRLLSHPLLTLPRNMHYLIDHMRNFCIALFLLLGNASFAYRASVIWLKWIEDNKQYLMDLTLNGGEYKHLSVKIAYQEVHSSFNNWFTAATKSVPNPSLLNSSLIRQQLLDGNAHINLPRAIEDLLAPRRSNNAPQQSSRQPSQAPSNGGRSSSSSNPSPTTRATHDGQPASLAVTPHMYKLAIGPAIMRGGVTVPNFKDRNGTEPCTECARYALLGNCDSGCPRAKAHVPCTDPNREKRLAGLRRACGQWYNANAKGANGPDFR